MAKSKVDRLDRSQLENAARALLAFCKKREGKCKDLLQSGDPERIYLLISLKQVRRQSKPNPKLLPLSHPVHTNDQVCLFVKDPKSLYKDQIKKSSISVHKVISVSGLKKYQKHDVKRKLCQGYDLFLADERIIPSLPRLIGKTFYSRKKQPISVRLNNIENMKARVSAVLNSAFLHLNKGTCNTVYLATSNFTHEQIVENVLSVMPKIIEKTHKKWSNIASLSLKSTNSIALPFYNSVKPVKVAKTTKEVEVTNE